MAAILRKAQEIKDKVNVNLARSEAAMSGVHNFTAATLGGREKPPSDFSRQVPPGGNTRANMAFRRSTKGSRRFIANIMPKVLRF